MTFPCWNCSLQTGCKIIAVLNVIGAAAYGAVMLVEASEEPDDAVMTGLAVLTMLVLMLGLEFLLFTGASQRNLKKVSINFWISMGVSAISWGYVIFDVFIDDQTLSCILIWILEIVSEIYFLVVIQYFRLELIAEKSQNAFGTLNVI